MTDLATLQARLAEAEAAYHKMMIGKLVVEIRHGLGEAMRFNKPESLLAYINDLKGQIATLTGAAGGRIRARRVAF
jgi:hypothetical protein